MNRRAAAAATHHGIVARDRWRVNTFYEK
jgi:hypothetical protein